MRSNIGDAKRCPLKFSPKISIDFNMRILSSFNISQTTNKIYDFGCFQGKTSVSPTECQQEWFWDVWENLGGLPLPQYLHQKSKTVPGSDYQVSYSLVGTCRWIWLNDNANSHKIVVEWSFWMLDKFCFLIQRTSMLGQGSWSDMVICHHLDLAS